jgi:ribosomal protein L9
MANETPDVIPELAELRTPPKAFSVPAPKELTGLSTQMGAGVPGVPEDFVAARAKFKKPTDVSTEQARMLQQQGRLEQDIGMATQAKEQYIAEAKADIATQERQAAQKIEADLDATRKKFPYPEFHPTKDNIQSLSTLFGLIGVIGASLGGAGKMSATTSLNAMGGMMNGWQQGRADLWKKEKDEFDKGMLKVKAVLEDAYKDADRAMKTLAYNRQEAEALANQSAAKLGGQVGKQILAKQGVERYFTFLDGVKKDLTEAEKRAFEQSKFAAEQEQRKRQFELQERRLDLQEKKANLEAQKKTDTGEIPKDAKTKEEYRARYEIIKNIEDIQSLLEDPKYKGLITPATKFTPDVVNNLRKNFPELSQKLARIQAIEFQIGGKALTAKEQEILSPIYAWKGLTADALKSRIAGVRENLQDVNNMTEVYYPGLKRIHSEFDRIYEQKGKVPEVPSVGGEDFEAQAKKSFGSYEPDKYEYGYENGKFYRDKK